MADPALAQQLEALHAESFGWALRCCADDAHGAEEVLQAAYLKVLDGRAAFAGGSSFKTFWFAVIRNTAADARRWAWLRRRRPATDDAPARHTAPAPDESAERAESADRLRRALATLPRRQQEVLQLTFYHGLSVAEAARAMNVGVGSARTHYARGKDALRARLGLAEPQDVSGAPGPRAGSAPPPGDDPAPPAALQFQSR